MPFKTDEYRIMTNRFGNFITKAKEDAIIERALSRLAMLESEGLTTAGNGRLVKSNGEAPRIFAGSITDDGPKSLDSISQADSERVLEKHFIEHREGGRRSYSL